MLAATSAWGCQQRQQIQGFPDSYAGVGLELTEREGRIRVVRPIQGGPSDAAGIQPGDEVVAINGEAIDGLSLGDVVNKLRGRPDSQLTLALERRGERILVVMKRRRLTKVTGEDYRPVPGR